ncbi:MAG: hypothetical protein D3914_05190 [Candidatus Electrothrix sp. LOE2]|nr:hypothetical protein [Candidatus Electrothrix sp. LOE2]
MPYYNFEDFKEACGKDFSNVLLIGFVRKDADDQFNLASKSKLLEFINNDGLESLKFVNTKPWEKNPDRQQEIFVDAYEFRSLTKLGYIAFMYSQKTSKWIIKSFHLSKNQNTTMQDALARAGVIQLGEE